MFQPPWLADNVSILQGILDRIANPDRPVISVEEATPPEERLLQLQEAYRELSAELLLLQQEQLRE
jgi:hypothetical protein